MLYHLAARALLMIAEGTDVSEAVDWVIRRIDRNLKRYYQLAIRRALLEVYSS